MSWFDSGKTIVIKRSDVQKVHDYARDHRDLRDFLLVRLPKRSGLRTREIATLAVQDINFETGDFRVLDSKKHRFYPLPLDSLTLQLIKDLCGDMTQGFVFRHKTYKKMEGTPLTNASIWKVIKSIGEEAGVKNFYPRILRHYFAANWISVEHKSMEGLRRILRHENLSVTHRYLQRLVFFEDVAKEYAEVRNGPIVEMEVSVNMKFRGNRNYEEFCCKCDHENVCKFINDFCSSPYATSCRHFILKEKMENSAMAPKQNRKICDMGSF